MERIKDNDKHLLVKKWLTSGKSMVAFCKEENIPFYFLQYWHRKLYKGKKSTKNSGFIKLKPERTPSFGSIFCEIQSANGHRIIFPDYIEVSFLKQLL